MLQLLTGLALAVVGFGLARAWESRERRRTMYAEAYRTAMERVELLYRVARRAEGTDNDVSAGFHAVQERIAFYRGWISSESPYVADAYKQLLDRITEVQQVVIDEAWASPGGRSNPGVRFATRPAIEKLDTEYLKIVRGHLTWNPIAKLPYWFSGCKWRRG